MRAHSTKDGSESGKKPDVFKRKSMTLEVPVHQTLIGITVTFNLRLLRDFDLKTFFSALVLFFVSSVVLN